MEDVDSQTSVVSHSVVPQSKILQSSSSSEIEFLRNRIMKLESIIDNLNATLNFVLSGQVSMSPSLSNNISDSVPIDPLFDILDINTIASQFSFSPESSS